MDGPRTRLALQAWTVLVLAFLFFPLVLIFVYAFNSSNIESWPLPGLTLRWLNVTWNDDQVRRSLLLSLQAGLTATGIALLLGS